MLLIHEDTTLTLSQVGVATMGMFIALICLEMVGVALVLYPMEANSTLKWRTSLLTNFSAPLMTLIASSTVYSPFTRCLPLPEFGEGCTLAVRGGWGQ